MASSIASVSQIELAQRRQKLRQRRRIKLLQSSWRVLAVSTLAGTSVWVATLPAWVIRRPEQVTIEGNHFLSVQTIRSLLAIPYPQSLLRVEPQTIAEQLKAKAPISEVTINRQLFAPGLKFAPGLVIQVKERYPVAVAASSTIAQSANSQFASPQAAKLAAIALPSNSGLIDESGMWIPLESYTSLDQSLKLPTLKIIGDREQYRPYWSTVYQEVKHSPVKVLEIDWRNPANVILTTELGIVHIGAYGPLFAAQLKTLDRMRKLSSLPNFSQISYIDLRNLAAPMVQLDKSREPVRSNT